MVSMTDSDAKGTGSGSKTGNGAPPVVDLSDDSNSGSNANVSVGGKPSAGAGTREGRRGSRGEILSEDGGGGGGSEGQIRVGKDYQVNPTNYIPPDQRRIEQCPERALLVWSPNDKLSQNKLDEYIQVSKEKYGYNAEQALGMLFWHKHDLDRAMQDLANFTPFPDEWTVEDKVLFEQAFQFHGKSFHRIRQMLPDKSIAQLVKYYYGWKKTRTRTSLMDGQARKLQVQREQGLLGGGLGGAGGAAASGVNTRTRGGAAAAAAAAATTTTSGDKKDNNSKSDKENSSSGAAATIDSVLSDDEDEKVNSALGTELSSSLSSKPKCFNCGILCHITHSTAKGEMCGTCHQYFQRTGNVRPTAAPMRRGGHGGSGAGGNSAARSAMLKAAGNYSNKPPRGIYINHDDLVSLATGPNTQGEQILKSMDREIVSYKRVVQNNKQLLSMMHRKAKETRTKKMSAERGLLTNPYPTPPTPAKTEAAKEAAATSGDNSEEPESRINAKWTNEELLLGVQGVRKFGKDFHAIAEVLGTKTESHVRSFYVNYRRKYNLDSAMKEYEAENGKTEGDAEMADVSADAETENGNGKTENGSSK